MRAMLALVTGATGLIGRRLCKRLERPTVLARNPLRAKEVLGPDVTALAWSDERPVPAGACDGVDVVFHLAGEAVAEKRLDQARRELIKQSRVRGTRAVVDAIAAAKQKPRVLVAASATGYYGDRGDDVLEEGATPGRDFLAEVCAAWEEEAAKAEAHGVRVVSARIGIVLDPAGGALAKMLPPFKLGVAGRLGDGRQWMPWIHAADVVGILLHAASHEAVRGPVNATAPGIVTNAELTRVMARVLRRPAFIPVPRFGLKLAYGDLADSLLASQRAIPAAISRAGYTFQFPELEPALRDLVV
jgi:uncharacterized protein (TIGR01777 family)